MYRIVINENERCCAFMRARVPHCLAQAETCIGLELRGKLIAVALYCNQTKFDIEMHTAIDGRVTRAWIIAAFSYPFLQLELPRVSTSVNRGNMQSGRLATKLGFRVEGCKRMGWDGQDLLQLGMLREECRFIATASPLVRAMLAEPTGTMQ